MFCVEPSERTAARDALAAASALRRWELIRFVGDAPADQALPDRAVKLDDGIASFLLDPPSCAGLVELVEVSDLVLPAAVERRATRYAREIRAGEHRIIQVVGEPGMGRRTLAQAIARTASRNVLVIRVPEPRADLGSASGLLQGLRLALLTSRIPMVVIDPRLAPEQRDAVARELDDRVPGLQESVFVITTAPVALSAGDLALSLAVPDVEARHLLWRRELADQPRELVDGAARALASRYLMTPGQVARTAERARHAAAADGRELTLDDLESAVREDGDGPRSHLLQRLTPAFGWSDIVLPPMTRAQLEAMCSQVRHRHRVLGTWGFGRRVPRGGGVVALFTGEPGCGKTMAAEVIAADLGLDLVRIDLASVVSKYIGDTEKNLSAVFEEARRTQAVLFFDEADALFGKRSEVNDARDRYANIEVNYLLQRIESYESVVVLASNLRENIDDAFFRRLSFAIEFPLPDAELRREIWEIALPSTAPRADDLDLDFLAERFRLSGGNIQNIALHAAYLAAGDRSDIAMHHLLLATRRELQKSGRLCTRAEFGPFYEAMVGTRATAG
jgi:hypothetical protein